jgi:hypothetical protein
LPPGSPAYGTESWEAFRQGLRTIGYADRDIEIESRWAEGRAERLPEFAAELVRLAPEVIVVGSSAAALTAKQATSTIPIVVTAFNDPVGSGHVASFAHPGGNVTGLSTMREDTVAKEVELLKISGAWCRAHCRSGRPWQPYTRRCAAHGAASGAGIGNRTPVLRGAQSGRDRQHLLGNGARARRCPRRPGQARL